MITKPLYPENISSIFVKHLPEPNTVFVFPTDTVMNSWIDWIVTNPDKSGFDAVPFERFIAWDNFKGSYLSAEKEGTTVIPTLLKQLFVHDLIQKNAEKPEDQRLKVVINHQDEFASSADSFADWITKNLSSLHFWKKRLDMYLSEYGNLDEEDQDYLFIYNEYKKFLAANNLFEPAWIENIELHDTKTQFIILYPELLQDFADFTDTLSKSENITIYTFPKDIPVPKAYLYSDSRKELRQTMLQIINLVKEGKADWSEIALSIPDLDTYRPYIEREFNLYKIPYVIKAGTKLTKNSAGRIFREIYNCYNSNFTFDSVRTLLLDECVPWKKEILQKKEDLIREGNKMHCICSPFETDIWLSALNSKIARLEKQEDSAEKLGYFNELKKFYESVKHSINNFFSEEFNTFSNIRRSWMEFKTKFLQNDKDFSETANNILSRCIKELDEIIAIEKNYAHCNLQLKSPFDFYLGIIDDKTYTPQTKLTGVNIYKYKLSAAANVKYQFVIDGSQKNLEISYKRLTFLNSTKRSKLHLLEDDKTLNATEVFMKLYAKNTETADQNFIHFSAATDSFAGFAIPHSLLNYTEEVPNLDSQDYIKNEEAFINSKGKSKNLIEKLTADQLQMFENWKATSLYSADEYNISDKLNALLSRKYHSENGNINVSARGDLEKFFPCPRKWLLSSVLKLHDDTLDTSLMQSYDMGNLNHKILELFMENFQDKKLPFYNPENDSFIINILAEGGLNGNDKDFTEELKSLLFTELVPKAIKAKSDFRDSPLVIKTLQNQNNSIAQVILTFLQTLLLPFPQGLGNCTVKGLEQAFTTAKETFNYYGRIDSLLQTPEGDLIIVDYKNSSTSIPAAKFIRVDEDGNLHDFQMPLYNHLVSSNFNKEIFGMYYYAIKDGTKRTALEMENPKATPEDYKETLKTLDIYANLFADQVNSGQLVPVQTKDSKSKLNVKSYEDCAKCTFKSICRTTYSIGGKEL